MSILERLVRLIAPHICLGCGSEDDRLLCANCLQLLQPVPSRCYRCRTATNDGAVCADCRKDTPLHQVMACVQYRGLAKELIHRMKYERAQAGVAEIALLLARQLAGFSGDAVLVPVPTATSRVRARGYDHAALLAREVSRLTNTPRRIVLRRVGQAHQVGSRRSQRLEQLQAAFRPVQVNEIRGRHIILIDDVLTTGATLEAAARVLRRAGAARVDAIVFAQA